LKYRGGINIAVLLQAQKEDFPMGSLLSVAVAASMMLIGLTGTAFAGVTAVPEPTTLAILAVGMGGAAVAKYLKRK
jgi:PEP-CTERM motif